MKSEVERLKLRLSSKSLLHKIAYGDKLYSQKKYQEAIKIYNELIEVIKSPYQFDLCELNRKVGDCYYMLGQNLEARNYYEKTLEYCTTNASIYKVLATLYAQDNTFLSQRYKAKAMSLTPKRFNNNAKSEYERLKLRITDSAILERIAAADRLYSEKCYDDAAKDYEELLKIVKEPYEFDMSELWRKIGNCYYFTKKHDEARTAYENTLKYCTTNGSIYGVLAYLYYYADSDIALKYYDKTLSLNPRDEVALSGKCLTVLKSDKYSQKQIKEILEHDVNRMREILMKGENPFTYRDVRLAHKEKLHIGYLSSDFKCHAMAQFVMPFMKNHDMKKYDFTLYSTTTTSDFVTEQYKNLGMEWKDCNGLSNKQLANVIHEDCVDILVDLSGLTHSRCFAHFYKPAPVIMQYLGFVNTCGMREIDYIFADDFTIPKGLEKDYTEKPLYLETYMQRFAFDINDPKWPALNDLPCKQNGFLTFGSFNCTSKINDYTIKLWSNLLKAVCNSKLLLYRTQMTADIIERFKKKFEANGISEERLIFNNVPFPNSHFHAYQMADVALDPTPFNGLTITLESIAMGVPVLTLVGESMQARGCARVNKTLGLDDLVAESEEEYVQKGKALAEDVQKLEYYRKNLREILSKSILTTDLRGFAECIEAAYDRAWQEFCKTL